MLETDTEVGFPKQAGIIKCISVVVQKKKIKMKVVNLLIQVVGLLIQVIINPLRRKSEFVVTAAINIYNNYIYL